jgi:hypothetical protein
MDKSKKKAGYINRPYKINQLKLSPAVKDYVCLAYGFMNKKRKSNQDSADEAYFFMRRSEVAKALGITEKSVSNIISRLRKIKIVCSNNHDLTPEFYGWLNEFLSTDRVSENYNFLINGKGKNYGNEKEQS